MPYLGDPGSQALLVYLCTMCMQQERQQKGHQACMSRLWLGHFSGGVEWAKCLAMVACMTTVQPVCSNRSITFCSIQHGLPNAMQTNALPVGVQSHVWCLQHTCVCKPIHSSHMNGPHAQTYLASGMVGAGITKNHCATLAAAARRSGLKTCSNRPCEDPGRHWHRRE